MTDVTDVIDAATAPDGKTLVEYSNYVPYKVVVSTMV